MSVIMLMIGLAILIYMTVRGINIIISAIIASVFVAITSGQDVVEAMTGTYMTGFTGYFASYFLLFLLGAVFGKVMGETGAAESIATWVMKVIGPKGAVMAVVLACAIMTYGGVSLFVVGFAVYPLAVSLFRTADLPRRFIPAALVFGSVTFTMFLPGSPEIQNIMPTEFFGTTPYSGFWIGMLVSIFNFAVGSLWLHFAISRSVKRGEKFEAHASDAELNEREKEQLPSILLAILPIVVVVAGMVTYSQMFSATSAAIFALLGAIVVACITMFRYITDFWRVLERGANDAILAACNTSAVIAFGKVAAVTSGFTQIVDAVLQIPGPPLLSLAICINLIAGLTGSASGGLGIALPILSPIYLNMGVDPGALHRVSVMASDGLASLPHNGYIVTTIKNICHDTFKRAYLPVAMMAVVLTMCATALAIILFTLFT
ncbi:GntP family permease [Lysinibacillus macroides]|uniref:Citrate transporter n=1 Tax=Lysinibacillus macroides TaxID=33935 RepID=A0A0M9DMJ7_9BACI|nr:GntP family permease [Lysinibacillus macroides]KOY83182.1 citrate transporter [Lysinibacillus macroides]QPR69039.1 GntP family permease [Lysinibacillus macroides]